MRRTWCTKSYVTKGAQVLSHQDLHTYSTFQYSIYSTLHYITLHYSKVQYITLHYSTLHYSTLQYIHAKDLEIVCHQRGTSPKSSERTYIYYITIQDITSQYIQNFQYFSIYLIALKYCLYINRRKKWKITDFCEIFFLKMGTSPKSSFFQRLARGLRPKNGVVQRGIQ